MAIRSEQLRSRKRRIEQRLENSSCEDRGRPMLWAAGIQYKLSDRSRGISYGGIGAMLKFVERFVLALSEGGRWAEPRRQEKRYVLSMEFKRFAGRFVMLPCQIVKTSRQIVY